MGGRRRGSGRADRGSASWHRLAAERIGGLACAGLPLEPDADGVRTGSYSAAGRQLLVEIAVPATLPDDPAGFLLSALRDAVELAERYALKEQIIARPLAELRALVAALELR